MGLTATNQGAAAPSAHKLHSTGNGIDESQAEGNQAPNNSNKTQGNEWRNKNRPIFPEFFFLLMWGSCVLCCRAGTDRRGGAAAAGGAWWSWRSWRSWPRCWTPLLPPPASIHPSRPCSSETSRFKVNIGHRLLTIKIVEKWKRNRGRIKCTAVVMWPTRNNSSRLSIK